MSLPRTTVSGETSVPGVGLFTARPGTLRIRPADDGVTFCRVDLPGAPRIPARFERLIDLPGLPPAMNARNTTLAAADHPGAFIATTEHLLSALAGLGVTDALLELDGPELPIGDGSARPFVEALEAAGLRPLGSTIERPGLAREVSVAAGPASIAATPREDGLCRLEYHLDYGPGAPIEPQVASIEFGPGAAARYARDVAPARTFCLAAEARAMRQMGLFGHITTREMLVVGDDGRPVEQDWRFPAEPARHKLLDLIGDLALAGPLPRATIVARRSGHALNHALARAIAQARA